MEQNTWKRARASGFHRLLNTENFRILGLFDPSIAICQNSRTRISRLRITALENKLSKLADRLDLSIGKPPSTA